MLRLHMNAITLIGVTTSVINLWFCKLLVNVIKIFCHHVQKYYFNLWFKYKKLKIFILLLIPFYKTSC